MYNIQYSSVSRSVMIHNSNDHYVVRDSTVGIRIYEYNNYFTRYNKTSTSIECTEDPIGRHFPVYDFYPCFWTPRLTLPKE